ncbi:MAG: glycosyltransferase family 87 protein [Hyphomonadaceae bacterium]|nr:glycosyltransferase family 87 protein [Hyphomonadaceae bacterium]
MLVTRRRARIGALVVAAATIAAMLTQAFGVRDAALANGQAVFGDYLAFWSAGRLALEGAAAQVHDAAALARMHRLGAPGADVLYLWNHPPTFLLVMSAFAAAPYLTSAVAFLTVGAAVYLAGARAISADRDALVLACCMPAALLHLGSAQTGLLTAGLTALALAWRDRRPIAAGACIGLLAIKPHLAVLWPLLLLVEGRRKTFAAAAVCAAAFVAAGAIAFGPEAYLRFFDNLASAQSLIDRQRVPSQTAASLYGALIGLGAPMALAAAAHAVSALAGLAVAMRVWRRGDASAAAAAFAAATLLASPYLFFYDFTLLGVAVAALARRAPAPALIFAWLAGGLSLAVGAAISLPVAPAAAWAALLASLAAGQPSAPAQLARATTSPM